MAQQNDTGFITFPAGEVMEIHSRVILHTDGTLLFGDLAHEHWIGTLQAAALAIGDLVPVKLRNAPGTHKVRCKEAVDVGDVLYTEADGEVQDTAEATGFKAGICVTAGSAENSVVEMIAIPLGTTAAQ